jgi:oligoribonuclease NrnB/cAMP/cGMP phosphodiesterase (DHH superfamily)
MICEYIYQKIEISIGIQCLQKNSHMNRPIQLNEVDFVIFHYPCSDGMFAAFVFKYCCRADIDLYPCSQRGTEIEMSKLNGRKGILVDILPDNIEEIRNHSSQIYVLDHHKTNAKKAADLDYCYFDMNKSGVGLAFEYCFGNGSDYCEDNIEMPYFLKAVQARDLWKFEDVPNSMVFTNGLYELYEPDVDYFGEYYEAFKKLFEEKINQEMINQIFDFGARVTRKKQKTIDFMINDTIVQSVKINVSLLLDDDEKKQYREDVSAFILQYENKIFHIAHLNNYNNMRSDYLNQCLTQFDIDFAFVYMYLPKENVYFYSFRSTDEKTDVSQICNAFGGGGHRNACGLTSKYSPRELFLFI